MQAALQAANTEAAERVARLEAGHTDACRAAEEAAGRSQAAAVGAAEERAREKVAAAVEEVRAEMKLEMAAREERGARWERWACARRS